MIRVILFIGVAALLFSLSAGALEGTAESDTIVLETVSPQLQSVSAATSNSLSAVFNEAMLAPGVTTPGNYAVSGLGIGTLDATPSEVTGSGPYTLGWATGEMQQGGPVTLAVTALRDVKGNPIDPAYVSASCTGQGDAPEFSGLAIDPSTAKEGTKVTITFVASEALDGNPVVTVNGNDATFKSAVKATTYTYEYEVQGPDKDPVGKANVLITGLDLAGNLGTLANEELLEIEKGQEPLPLAIWPAVVALSLAGALVLARRPRSVKSLLMLALLLAAPLAMAQPVISNLEVVQVPGVTLDTQVNITFDLESPGDPCDITVSLSKDGGADGYIHPINSYSGDIADQATGAKTIVWNLAKDYPNQTLAEARIKVTASDVPLTHDLTYAAGPNGNVTGILAQTVDHGADGTAVTAEAAPHYHFVDWSDGSTDRIRQDLSVTANIDVIANFTMDTYTLKYIAGANGTITGNTDQEVLYNTSGTPVTAVPNQGYGFVKWDDGLLTPYRLDTNVSEDITATAEFAPLITYYKDLDTDTYGITTDSQQLVAPAAPYTALLGGDCNDADPAINPGVTEVCDDGIDNNCNTQIDEGCGLSVDTFAIQNRLPVTASQAVLLNNTVINGIPDEYQASEDVNFLDATTTAWLPYSTAPTFTLSAGAGVKTVYFRVRNVVRVSPAKSDTIELIGFTEMVSIPGGTFTMGRLDTGDDSAGYINELPRHQVTLTAYQIGKYEVTTQAYCDVLNWAKGQGYLKDASGNAWSSGAIYAGTISRYLIVALTNLDCNVQYSGGTFSPKTRTGTGGVTYSTADHPMVRVTWYGAVAFCNWLSEISGLNPYYNMAALYWPMVTPAAPAGFRLPTEAEWERAAAWDGSRHWIYGYTSDATPTADRCNFTGVNPLGLTTQPNTAPIGWFNGTNISPNGTVTTVNSVSPAGCYDMSGNVWEWCGDWYELYTADPVTDPTGPATAPSTPYKVYRGGEWGMAASVCRTAQRVGTGPGLASKSVGFRIVQR